jgi:hypothetical protein
MTSVQGQPVMHPQSGMVIGQENLSGGGPSLGRDASTILS